MKDGPLWQLFYVHVEYVLPRVAVNSTYLVPDHVEVIESLSYEICCEIHRRSDQDLVIWVLHDHISNNSSKHFCFASPRRTLYKRHSLSTGPSDGFLLTRVELRHALTVELHAQFLISVKGSLRLRLIDTLLHQSLPLRNISLADVKGVVDRSYLAENVRRVVPHSEVKPVHVLNFGRRSFLSLLLIQRIHHIDLQGDLEVGTVADGLDLLHNTCANVVFASLALYDSHTQDDMLSDVRMDLLRHLQAQSTVNFLPLFKLEIDVALRDQLCVEALTLCLRHEELLELLHVLGLAFKPQRHLQLLESELVVSFCSSFSPAHICLFSDEAGLLTFWVSALFKVRAAPLTFTPHFLFRQLKLVGLPNFLSATLSRFEEKWVIFTFVLFIRGVLVEGH